MIDAAAASVQSQIQSPDKTNVASKPIGSKLRRVTEKTMNAAPSEIYANSRAVKGVIMKEVAIRHEDNS